MDDQLRKLQLTQLEMLKMVDSICKKHDINYSLYCGTLLGAVRHKGFIPWDDDLDICMSREDYNRFISIWNNEKHEGYILQNKENEPAFSQSFTKIRKDHTTFLQLEREAGLYHTGIFIDIFPIDRCPNGKITGAIFRFRCMLYQLYTREFVPPLSGKTTKLASRILLLCVPKKVRPRVRCSLLSKITKYNTNNELSTVAIQTVHSMHIKYPADMLESFTILKFEDAEFMCFAKWDENLKCHYGNYMKFPPVEEQTWSHHPILLDFEHNYDEIAAEITTE